ncbi:MAG: flavin reductase, partial [Clostridia bacterium]|nr:flavin reductase [Clostridia bacterium]
MGSTYVGVNDHKIDLFEGQYRVPDGMSYNSWAIIGGKVAVTDTVDRRFTHEWLDNIEKALGGRKPDYLVIHHMEPDHSANIIAFTQTYPECRVVSSQKAFTMMKQFYGDDFETRRVVIKEGDTLDLEGYTLSFIAAPMVHWPEAMMSYESTEKILFSADGFGSFGARDAAGDMWPAEARRYYIGIVGKYGAQVQAVLKKAANLDIAKIYPLHGRDLTENLGYYLNLYNTWSSYGVEKAGIAVFYTSVYGNTKKAAELLADRLKAKGCPEVSLMDLARSDMSEAISRAFAFGRIVLATTTYNADIFPFMRQFVEGLRERNFQNRTVGIIENGSWAPQAAKVIKGLLSECKNLTILEPAVKLTGALDDISKTQLEALSDELCRDYLAQSDLTANKNDLTALFKIGYGLYVVTSNDGKKDNGLIVNTVTQVTNTPNRVAVCINKQNYSHHIIQQTGVMNVNCLSTEAPFSVFEAFGFRSGRTVNKFEGTDVLRSDNGLVFLPKYINAFMSLKV